MLQTKKSVSSHFVNIYNIKFDELSDFAGLEPHSSSWSELLSDFEQMRSTTNTVTLEDIAEEYLEDYTIYKKAALNLGSGFDKLSTILKNLQTKLSRCQELVDQINQIISNSQSQLDMLQIKDIVATSGLRKASIPHSSYSTNSRVPDNQHIVDELFSRVKQLSQEIETIKKDRTVDSSSGRKFLQMVQGRQTFGPEDILIQENPLTQNFNEGSPQNGSLLACKGISRDLFQSQIEQENSDWDQKQISNRPTAAFNTEVELESCDQSPMSYKTGIIDDITSLKDYPDDSEAAETQRYSQEKQLYPDRKSDLAFEMTRSQQTISENRNAEVDGILKPWLQVINEMFRQNKINSQQKQFLKANIVDQQKLQKLMLDNIQTGQNFSNEDALHQHVLEFLEQNSMLN